MISTDVPEEVVKILKIGTDGFPSCHVGYILRRLFRKFDPKSFEKLFLKVEEDYRLSDNSHEQHQSHHHHGMARCLVIHNNCQFNSRDCFNGDACILLDNEGTSSGKKKNNEKEKISVTDKEKLLAKFVNTSTHCTPIPFNQVPIQRWYTPVHQPRLALAVGGPQDDNSTVTDAVTVQVLEEDNTPVSNSLTAPIVEEIPIQEDANTTVTKALTIVAAVEESKSKVVQKKKYIFLLRKKTKGITRF
jgi:hypothetical protein